MEKETIQNLSAIREHIANYQKCISASMSQTVGIKTDGTVVAVGYDKDAEYCDQNWQNIVAISTNTYIVGLRANGTIVRNGGGNQSEWRNIIDVCENVQHTVGLKADGTVVAAGVNKDGQCNVQEWRNIIAICTSFNHTVGLKADGKVVATGENKYGQCNVQEWRNIISVFTNYACTFGLKADGTLVVVGNNDNGQCNVQNWKDIITICNGGGSYTVGLKADGTVVATGENKYGECNVQEWSNIVAISVGSFYTVGLKSDGTVVATGRNGDGQCDVQNWSNIVAIFSDSYHTVGLKADGTVVAVGDNSNGQCDTQNWQDIGPISKELCLKREQENANKPITENKIINKLVKENEIIHGPEYRFISEGIANNNNDAIQLYNEYLKTYLCNISGMYMTSTYIGNGFSAFVLYKKLIGKNLNSLEKNKLLELLIFAMEEEKEIRKYEEEKEKCTKKVDEENEKLKRTNWFDRQFRKEKIIELEKSLEKQKNILNKVLSNQRVKAVITLFPYEYRERPNNIDWFDWDDWVDGREHPLSKMKEFVERGIANNWQEAATQYERYKKYLRERINQKRLNKKLEALYEKTEEAKKAAEWAAWMAWMNRR